MYEESLNRDTKAVVLTANAVAGSRKMYIDAGFADYLTKPLDSIVLEQMVKTMLPKEKVKMGKPEDEVLEFEASDGSETEAAADIKKRLMAIEGLDYDKALRHCAGDEDFLAEVISDITAECRERTERMKKALKDSDLKSYGIDAHSIKSTMATIGLTSFSERAKKHEFAAKEDNTGFIDEDAEGFLDEYVSLCERLKG